MFCNSRQYTYILKPLAIGNPPKNTRQYRLKLKATREATQRARAAAFAKTPRARALLRAAKKEAAEKWLKPVYTKLTRHKTPSGRILRTKAGTQVIDRAWRFLKAHLTGVSAKPRSVMLNAHIRSAQWHYWCRGKDLWLEMGKTLA